jgi:aryl-alcohol dehydrogenase-like predicted oxidoreductase
MGAAGDKAEIQRQLAGRCSLAVRARVGRAAALARRRDARAAAAMPGLDLVGRRRMAGAAAHGVTPAQAALRWGLQRTRGVVIPRSANATHMRDNMDVFGFALSDAEMAALAGLPQKKIFSVYCQPWC